MLNVRAIKLTSRKVKTKSLKALKRTLDHPGGNRGRFKLSVSANFCFSLAPGPQKSVKLKVFFSSVNKTGENVKEFDEIL